MQKRAFIIHGWGEHPDKSWLPWLKGELESNGFAVFIPAMPNSNEPRVKAWVSHLAKQVGEPDEHTYFVGHSIGCQTILRYLETLENKKVGGAVFVAGWFYLENLEETEKPIARPWLEKSIDFKNVRAATDKFVVILSNNDPYNALKQNREAFEESLGAQIIIEHEKGHFSGSDGVTELPSALNAILKYAETR